MKHCQIFLILLLFCVFTSACGLLGGKKVACQYVSRADAETVLGVSLKLERGVAAETDTRCAYTAADKGKFAEMTVIIQSFATKDELDSADESYKKLKADDKNLQTLKIGDAAWTASSLNGHSQIIFVRKNNVGFHIVADGSDVDEATREKLKALAGRIAERL